MRALFQIVDPSEPSAVELIRVSEGLDTDAVARELSQRLVDQAGSGKRLGEIVTELADDIGAGRWRPRD